MEEQRIAQDEAGDKPKIAKEVRQELERAKTQWEEDKMEMESILSGDTKPSSKRSRNGEEEVQTVMAQGRY